MSSQELDEYYETAIALTKQAGELIRTRIQSAKTVNEKADDIDLVTETDQEVEKLVIETISKKYPSHKFIGEETAATGKKQDLTDDPTWIIDPVDGTMNFVHSFPHCCILISLYIKKQPQIGICYNPVLEQFYTARAGQGAYLNGTKIKVSGQKDLSKALLMLESGTSRDLDKMEVYRKNNEIFVPIIHGSRSLGKEDAKSSEIIHLPIIHANSLTKFKGLNWNLYLRGACGLDIAMVAQGAADAYFEFGVHAWDYGAGALIVREAGGVAIDPSGGPLDIMSRRVLVASSQELADAIVQKIVNFYPKPRDDD